MRSRMQLIATGVAVAAVVLPLGACSRGGSSGSASSSGSGQSSAASGSKSAVMIMSTLNNPFFVSVKNGAQAQAAKLGIKLNVQNANNSDAAALKPLLARVASAP